MAKIQWRELLFPNLAACAPYLCLIGFFAFDGNTDHMQIWIAVAACCGLVAGAVWLFRSVAGAALTSAVVSPLAFCFLDFSHDGGIILLLGFVILMPYLAGLLVGVPAGYLLRMFSMSSETSEAEELELLQTQDALLKKK